MSTVNLTNFILNDASKNMLIDMIKKSSISISNPVLEFKSNKHIDFSIDITMFDIDLEDFQKMVKK